MIMISGDNQRVVDAVARTVGLDEALGYRAVELPDRRQTVADFAEAARVALDPSIAIEVGEGTVDGTAIVALLVPEVDSASRPCRCLLYTSPSPRD